MFIEKDESGVLGLYTKNFEKDVEFYDFIDTAFSFSIESLQDFHAFMIKGYDYEKANTEIYYGIVLVVYGAGRIGDEEVKFSDNAMSAILLYSYMRINKDDFFKPLILKDWNELLNGVVQYEQ